MFERLSICFQFHLEGAGLVSGPTSASTYETVRDGYRCRPTVITHNKLVKVLIKNTSSEKIPQGKQKFDLFKKLTVRMSGLVRESIESM